MIYFPHYVARILRLNLNWSYAMKSYNKVDGLSRRGWAVEYDRVFKLGLSISDTKSDQGTYTIFSRNIRQLKIT